MYLHSSALSLHAIDNFTDVCEYIILAMQRNVLLSLLHERIWTEGHILMGRPKKKATAMLSD